MQWSDTGRNGGGLQWKELPQRTVSLEEEEEKDDDDDDDDVDDDDNNNDDNNNNNTFIFYLKNDFIGKF